MYTRPHRLRAGDTVASISLSSGAAAAFPGRYEIGKRQLEETFGLQVIETPHALCDDAFLRANPQARAEDLNWALENPDVRGIFSTIGGDDSVRILPYLDLERIRANPKVFLGFSDASITLTAFLRAGVHAFHGPAILTDLAEAGGIRPYVERSLRRVLFDPAPHDLEAAGVWSEQFLDWAEPQNLSIERDFIPSEGWHWLQGDGNVRGHLLGGSIEALEMLKGTQWWLPVERWEGAILVFETSEEAPPPEVVGRFLRNYGAQGILGKASGMLFARPMRYSMEQRWQLEEEILRILTEFDRQDLPLVTNVDFGHTSPQLTLPLGTRAEIDTEDRRVRLLEPAVQP